MTLEELKSLREGEVVVITKVDGSINEFYNYVFGDELVFYKFNTDTNVVDFVRTSGEYAVISNFTYDVCHYIERKVKLERDNKLNILGI